jgi:glycosyltransferase involved in cell wall biosynthesis
MKITIAVPCFNEEQFIVELLEDLHKNFVNITDRYVEVLIIDDGSRDTSRLLIRQWIDASPEKSSIYKLLVHEHNQGKGAAVRTAIARSTGDVFLIQDSDLEYDPAEIPRLLNAFLKHRSEGIVAVYGSRNLVWTRDEQTRVRLSRNRGQSLMPWLFGHLLSFVFLIRFKIYVSDLLTGYKLMPTHLLKQIEFRTQGFETDHEISRFLVAKGVRIVEVPITYSPRTREQGKKIGWRDAIFALRELTTR